ncbi:MAG: hypothetical protein KC416_12845 [Myxococcales bacterium]|nr:hypothetical protein [Myxococcales bacterium]
MFEVLMPMLGLLAAVGGLGLLVETLGPNGRRARQRRRFAAEVPLSADQLVIGRRVRVDGRIQTQKVLEAPLTARSCAAYELGASVERFHEGKRYWTPLGRFHAAEDLFLVDGADSVRIDMTHCSMHVSICEEQIFYDLLELPADVEHFLRERKVPIDRWLKTGKAVRLREGVLANGERASALGKVRFECTDASTNGYRGGAGGKVGRVLVGTESEPVEISDDPELIGPAEEDRPLSPATSNHDL